MEGDNVYVVVNSEQLNEILKAFGHEEKTSKNFNHRRWKYWFSFSKNVRRKF